MRKFNIILFYVLSAAVNAAEYNVSVIGKETDPAGGNYSVAAFDGHDNTWLGWTDKQARRPCGIVLNFYRPHEFKMVEIDTDPGIGKILPSAECWDPDGFRWVPLSDSAGWKHADGGRYFLEAAAKRKSIALRLMLQDSRLRIRECRVFGNGNDGKSVLLTQPQKVGKKFPTVIVPDRLSDMVSGNIRMTLWQPGGIGKKFIAVGLCNGTPRNDRVLLRTDCSRLIEKGRVKRAELVFTAEPFGQKQPRSFQIEYLHSDNPELEKNDFSRDSTTPVAEFVSGELKYPQIYRIDVTEIVNSALERGAGVCKFRFRDLKADTQGNPKKITDGISLSSVELDVEQ